MKRKGLIATVVAAILIIALAVTLIAAYFTQKYFVVLDWQLYPRDQQVLDLKNRAMTAEEFDRLAEELPDSRIVWSVPFQGGYVPSDTRELTVRSLRSEDVELISYFTELKTIHADDCKDYEELLTLYRSFPEISVEYSVEVGGKSFSAEETVITLERLTEDDIDKLGYLPNLETVDAMQCPDYAAVVTLAQEHSEWEVKYLTSIAGAEVDVDAESLEMTAATVGETAYALTIMPKLKEVMIHDPDAEGSELVALREKYPEVTIRWDVTLEGQTFDDDIRELDLSYFPLTELEDAKQAASRFPNLEKLIVDSGAVENEEMAAYREEMRERFQVIWTVSLGKICKLRTDETWFMPIQQGDYYFNDEAAYNLRYCEEMVCMDVGHAPIHTVEFLEFMPHLKYLILAHTQVKDISPISGCKELLFLELDGSLVRDYSPLLGCTSLEDLNIGDTYADVEPLCQMTWLKNLWCVKRGYGVATTLSEALPDTRVNYAGDRTVANGWRMLDNYYAMRDMLGVGYMQ